VVLHQLLHVLLINLQAHGTAQTHNFLAQQALPPTVERLKSLKATLSVHNGVQAELQHLTETSFQATTIKKTASTGRSGL